MSHFCYKELSHGFQFDDEMAFPLKGLNLPQFHSLYAYLLYGICNWNFLFQAHPDLSCILVNKIFLQFMPCGRNKGHNFSCLEIMQREAVVLWVRFSG
jgi:hypothetical protein